MTRTSLRIFHLLAFVVAGLIDSYSAETCDGAPLSPEQRRKAASLLLHRKDEVRQRAYDAFRKMGKEAVSTYKEMLEEARDVHLSKLDEGLLKAQRAASPFTKAHDAWKAARDECLAYLRTELKGDSDKLAELERHYERTDRSYRQTIKSLSKADDLITGLLPLNALREIMRELDYCEGDEAPELASVRSVLRESVYDDEITDIMRRVERINAIESDHKGARTYNEKARWPEPGQNAFAEILNQRRRVFGLSAFYLEAHLSAGCLAHCQEMVALGYFSHDSPVEENRTPSRRARNANYQGHFRGENIYVGGGGFSGAFGSWWRSDGHRFLMFADGGNHLGIASAGGHWTLNTGDGGVPELAPPGKIGPVRRK